MDGTPHIALRANWQDVLGYAWHPGTIYLVGAVALVGLLLFRFKPAIRPTLSNTLLFFTASLAGLLVSGLVHAAGFAKLASVLHEIFLICEGLAVIRLTGLFVFRILLPLVRLTPPSILEDMLVIIGYIAWGMVRLRYAGVDLGSILATSAVITAVIAFSMQDTLGNIMGGVALELDSAFEIGDWIKVDDISGKVVDIRWRSTSVETRNGETVVIPNSVLMRTKFSVLGRRAGQAHQWRRWVWFNVDYNIPPVRVIQIVDAAIQSADIAQVAKQPRPNCIMMDFDRSSARYAVRYWLTDLVLDDATDSAIRTHVYAALQRAGIRIPVPEQNVHVVEETEKREEARRSHEISRRMAVLRKIDLFALLSEEELHTIADRLVYAPFAKGDVVTRQGAVAHWLYILTDGLAEVIRETPGRPNRVLSTIQAGSFFGEMGLMTGAPRAATVVAKTDIECYRLDKESFESIIHSRPAIADEISHILASRRSALDSAQEHMTDAAQPEPAAPKTESEIVGMIKHFFGLSD